MNDAPHNWKEARRLQAWHLKQQGWSQRQIATAMGVSEGAVSQWMKRAREGGLEALRHRPPPGAPRRTYAGQVRANSRAIFRMIHQRLTPAQAERARRAQRS